MKFPGQESSILEFKSDIPKNDEIIKTIIAFCNQHGGRLILGVHDDGTIKGLSEEEIEKALEYLNKMIYESSNPPIIPRIYTQLIGEKTVFTVEVSSGMNKPYFIKSKGLEKGVYIRLGRSTMKANADMIYEMQWQARGRGYDMMPVYQASQDDVDTLYFKEFLEKRKKASAVSVSREMLQSYNVITQEHGHEYPTVAGILLFGKKPQKFFSEATIICTHFAGIEGREAIASVDCNGTLFNQFHAAYEFIVTHLYWSFTIEGPRRREQLEIPEQAIREVLINALVHRNYHINAPIKIAIYRNRVEFFSPGSFPGPINVSNLTMGITYIRNRAIAKVFREADYIEKLGSGFITLFRSYEERGLEKPAVIEGENYIKCILPRPRVDQKVPLKSSDDTSSVGQSRILSLFDTATEITVADVIDCFQVARSTAGRWLKSLVDQGLIVMLGTGRGARYIKKT